MQTCTICQTQSSDIVRYCIKCGADLHEHSEMAVARANLIANPRVRNIRVVVSADACPTCQMVEGTYEKENVPYLPVMGCSSVNGCKCFYEPHLNEIYP